MSDLAVRTTGLTKRYGQQVAVDGVDLAVPAGAVYGFLGPNGSGKTTTIRVLLGLARPSGGEVELLGSPMPASWRDVLPRVGALVEGPAFYPWLSGPANLARLDAADRDADPRTRRARVGAALERVGLARAGRKRVKAYSLGMKQRLGIAGALLRPRDLLVLDEPTNGLDPQGTREVRTLVRSLAADGTTLVVSSHLLAEIEQVCSHVGVMSGGRLVAQGTLAGLAEESERELVLLTPDPDEARRVLQARGLGTTAGAGAAYDRAATLVAALPRDGAPAVEDVVASLVTAGVRVRGVHVRAQTLEERFVELTGEGFEVRG
ncbi:ABC transporter ATP-binding protein [Aquipuribacter sp. SD81]|uniref:ABC transporter ATP-binding protein n=1 Tax=Aquipuribacter sp. SD81 TaxID=3127703 RepID=UPI00301AE783